MKTQNLEEENEFKKEEIIKLKVKAKALQKEYKALTKGKEDRKEEDALGENEANERDDEEETKQLNQQIDLKTLLNERSWEKQIQNILKTLIDEYVAVLSQDF